MLLNIFDLYRQDFDPNFYHWWRDGYKWLNLAHACRRWRAVVLSSTSRLDIAITVGPSKPGDIETILSRYLAIFIDYWCKHEYPTDSTLWRMRSALEHRDRVRGITLNGPHQWFGDFFEATKYPFPLLESIYLYDRSGGMEIPDTFLGGPDLSYLHLRSLKLRSVSLASISRFLSFATSLTDLYLSTPTVFSPSAGMSLLASLQGMPFLCELSLLNMGIDSQSQPLIPKDTVPLSKLTSFCYTGSDVFLQALVAGLSASSLLNVNIYVKHFRDTIRSPTVHLSRFIDEIEEHYHAAHVIIADLSSFFSLSLLTLEYAWGQRELCFELGRDSEPFSESLMRMSGALSTRFSAVEELSIRFGYHSRAGYVWEDHIPWHRFYQHFPCVKTLKIPPSMACTLLQDPDHDDLDFLSALEEIKVVLFPFPTDESQRESHLAVFQPFLSVRRLGGRPVKVSAAVDDSE